MASDENLGLFRRISAHILSQIIVVPFVKRPFQDLENPSKYGMKNAINLRIPLSQSESESPSDETIGAWLMSPVQEGDYSDQDPEVEEASQVIDVFI